jgi:hypothetical protein
MAGRSAGGAGDIPFASLFDPVSNARVMGDIQAQALRAAGDLVERLLAVAEALPKPGAPFPTASGTGNGSTGRSDDASRLIDAWVEMLQRISGAFGTRSGDENSQQVDVEVGDGAAPCLRFCADESGELVQGEAEVWLHNGTPDPFGPLTIGSGDLISPEGERLAAHVVCEPAAIAELPPRSSRGVIVSLAPEGELHRGVFRGLLQVRGAPGVWFPVEVAVGDSRP